jgi:hypothetical protein
MALTSCLQCSVQFQRKASQLKKYPRSFCSRRCKGDWQLANPTVCSPPITKAEYPCDGCGKLVIRTPAQIVGHIFCGMKCAGVTRIKGGKSHPKWKGGVSPYAPEFNKWKREKIKRRDGHRCRICGNIGTAKHGLEVHHRDQDKANNDDSNLITLCKVCHDSVHRGTKECPQP